jgi:thiol-disulfide isomerase/thioredoxin
MYRRVALLCAAAFLAACASEPAPRFRAKTIDGEVFTNESLAGKVTLVQFWTTWCGYCRRDQPAVDAVAKEFSGQGLVVLAVDVGESRKKVKRYLAESPRSCNIVLNEDTNLPALFAATSYPVYVLIDRAGMVVAVERGAMGENGLRDLLAKAGLSDE